MATYRIGNLVESVKMTDWFLANASLALGNTARKYVPVTSENIDESDLENLEKFFKAIKLELDSIDNFGLVSYENLEFKGYCPAYICLYGEEQRLGLVIGSDDNKNGLLKATFVPITVSVSDDENEPFVYKVGGRKLALKEATDEKGLPNGKTFIVLTAGRDEYSIPVLLNKGVDTDTLFENFLAGELAQSLRPFGSGTGNAMFPKANRLFSDLFVNDKFPKEGVLILMKNGKREFKAACESTGGKDITSSTWEVVSTSHPELIVTVAMGKEKVPTFFPLEEIATIQFPESGQPTKFIDNSGKDEFNGLVLVKMIGINRSTKNPNHIPAHAFVSDVGGFAYAGIENYPHMVPDLSEAPKQLTAALETPVATPEKAKKVSMPSKAKPVMVDGEYENDLIPF